MEDKTLIENSLKGDQKALEQLIKKHQDWVYNIAINLTANTEDAADLMQETLVKMITKLSQFKQESAFRTWVYRILKNTFLNSKRKKDYQQTMDWALFAEGLDNITDETFEDKKQEAIVQEAKHSCMKAMLLCLTPEQRLVYVLGELFALPDSIGSEVMEISKANFRKKLSRSREQLYGFMHNKCGLINTDNPCRCARKTRGFIKKGYVNPHHLQFQQEVLTSIEGVVAQKVNTFDNEGYVAYQKLYQHHNFQSAADKLSSLKKLLSRDDIKGTFELN